ncbi:hypothetical protein [Spirosoma litoris]
MSLFLFAEKMWLAEIQQTRRLGIAFIDGQGRDIQVYIDDPLFRQTIIAYQKERICQLELDEGTIGGQSEPQPYPSRDDMILLDDAQPFGDLAKCFEELKAHRSKLQTPDNPDHET